MLSGDVLRISRTPHFSLTAPMLCRIFRAPTATANLISGSNLMKSLPCGSGAGKVSSRGEDGLAGDFSGGRLDDDGLAGDDGRRGAQRISGGGSSNGNDGTAPEIPGGGFAGERVDAAVGVRNLGEPTLCFERKKKRRVLRKEWGTHASTVW
jgi:hypothetical protein